MSSKSKKKTKTKKEPVTEIEEDIILQLPISVMKKGDDYEDALPTNINNAFTEADDEVHAVFTVGDITSDSSSEDSYMGYKNDTKKELINILKNKDDEINKLKAELEQVKEIVPNGDGDDKTHAINIELRYDSTGKKVLFKKKTYECLWCGSKFNYKPYVLPVRRHNNIYYVDNHFCCVKCVFAENFHINDYKTWERSSLISRLYDVHDVTLAPPRKAMKQYEGGIDPKDIRGKDEKGYTYFEEPMISVTTYVEEKYKNRLPRFKDSTSSDNLVLKRSKPLPTNKMALGDTIKLINKKKKVR